jgi:hypothetical protein
MPLGRRMVLMTTPTLHNQEQLIQWLSRHAKVPAIVRALDEGSLFYYGWFEPEGFVLVVKSRFGRVWTLGIRPVNFTKYQVDFLTDIPWGHYTGGSTELYSGDFPVLCHEEKVKIRKGLR